MTGLAPRSLAAAGLAACLALLGCQSAPEQDAKSLVPLTGVPLSADLRVAAADAWDGLGRDPGAPPAAADLRAYDRIVARLQPLQAAEAAADLYARWRDEPDNLLWFGLAYRSRRRLPPTAPLDSMLALPALSDTNLAMGRYVDGVRRLRGQQRVDRMRHVLAQDGAGLAPLNRVWAAYRLAYYEDRAGDTDRAIARALEAMPEARMVGGPALETHLWLRLTGILSRARRFDDALHAACVAEALARAADTPYRALKARIAVADVLGRRNERDAAADLFATAMHEAERLDFPTLIAEACEKSAGNLAALGRHREAIDPWLTVIDVRRAMADSLNLPRAMCSLSYHYRVMGELDLCRSWLDSARACIAAYPEPSNVAGLPSYLIPYYLRVGEYAVVDSLVAEAKRHLPEGASPSGLVDILLADLVQATQSGRPTDAYTTIERIADLTSHLVDDAPTERNQLAACEIVIADFHALQGEFRLAHEHLARAAIRLEAKDNEYQRWVLSWSRGKLAYLAGDTLGARRHLAETLAQARAMADPDRIAASRYHLGHLELAAGDLAAAERLFAPEPGDTPYGGNFRLQLASRIGLAEVAVARGEYAQALDHCARADTLATRRIPVDLGVRLATQRGRALSRLGQRSAAADAFLEALATLVADSGTTPQGDARIFSGEDGRVALEELVGILLASPDLCDGDPPLATLALVESMRGLSARHAATGSRSEADISRVLAGWSGPVVATLVGEERSHLWLVDHGHVTVHPLPSRHDLAPLAHALARSVSRPGTPVDTAAARALGTLLLSPAMDRWPRGATLTVVADGDLAGLPWSLLVVPVGSPRILAVDHGPIVAMPDLRTAPATAARVPATRAILALGVDATVPAADGSSPLRHAEQEARDVAALWPSRLADLRTGEAAGWESLAGRDLARYGVIHLATHATVHQAVPGRTTLHLAGTDASQPVTSDGLADLRLDADLVYLSCCEATRPLHAGGVDDMTHALLTAGAASVVASPQRVDDAASRALATAFYRHWLAGESRATALLAARREVRSDPRWEHPFYWSTYRLIGRGD